MYYLKCLNMILCFVLSLFLLIGILKEAFLNVLECFRFLGLSRSILITFFSPYVHLDHLFMSVVCI